MHDGSLNFLAERYRWKRIPHQGGTAPPRLEGASLNFVGEFLFLFGGFDGRNFSQQSHVLDLGLHLSHPFPFACTKRGMHAHPTQT